MGQQDQNKNMNEGDSGQGGFGISITSRPHKSSIDTLDEPHRVAISRAISNILSTEIAEMTYAQIVDGLPLSQVFNDNFGGEDFEDDHPMYTHKELGPGVLDTVRGFRAGFDPETLQFDALVRIYHPQF